MKYNVELYFLNFLNPFYWFLVWLVTALTFHCKIVILAAQGHCEEERKESYLCRYKFSVFSHFCILLKLDKARAGSHVGGKSVPMKFHKIIQRRK